MLVLALIGGLLSLTSSSSDSKETQAAHRDLGPFREAVDDLATAQGLRYKDTSAFGITDNDITVTASGSQFSTPSSGRNDNGRDVLRIGGKTFLRWQKDPAPAAETDPEAGSDGEAGGTQPSEWTDGLDDGSVLVDEAQSRSMAPGELAAELSEALTSLGPVRDRDHVAGARLRSQMMAPRS
ncbi:hypothetical protein JL475_37510, partial [Streptomyces sp. M2CJ-2]|uniref:hypothetical protein n=1 Tax=Streptomyces sp. M2CJ-2 TaxID=2803948 RepID=UPI001925450C